MKPSKALRNIRTLSDSEIKACINGKVSILVVKDIFTCPGVIKHNGFVFTDLFADLFASRLQVFLDSDEGSEEWNDADYENYEWGMSIACNINDLLCNQEYAN